MTIERVNYFDRQFLRLEDFADEQSYQIAMRRRHNISHHSWGIVEGLEPQFVQGTLCVTPGLAIDGFGRELVSETLQALPTESFVDLDTNELEAWIDYTTASTTPPPNGYAACGSDGAGQFYRISEQARVRLSRPDPSSRPRLPGSVLPTDADFDATRPAPEDRNWPIFLGSVMFDPKKTDAPYSIDLSGRPYAGLIGEGVTAPSGRTRVQIGAELASDSNRFAVFVPATDQSPRLAIREDGTINGRGETTLEGNLTIGGGALEIGVGPASSPQPWRLYRVQETDSAGRLHNELRVEMAGGSGGNNQIVFGAWSQKDSKFKPGLTIADDGTVTVGGNLVIKGKLDVNPESVVPGELSTEAMAYVASGALANFTFNSAQLARAAQLSNQGAVGGANSAPGSTDQRIRELAATIAHPDPERLKTFAAVMKTDFKDAAAKLKKILEE